MKDAMTATWIRPEPSTSQGVRIVNRHDDAALIASALCSGETACVGDLYSTGLTILAQVRQVLSQNAPVDNNELSDYTKSRAYRSAYRIASHRLLAPISDHLIALRKAPIIGWLQELYPDTSDFHLSFPQLQGLNSSWQWYVRGIELPGIDHSLHPFYGTYFPTRFDHLELFASWLHTFEGSRTLAFDIGTGCGIMALQLSRAAFPRIVATDINPNAIESVRRHLAQHPAQAIEPVVGDLFGDHCETADLVVFNPPWMPGEPEGPIDQAIYYEDRFFERFFEQAVSHMNDDARLVILFSNLPQLASGEAIHPVEQELSANARFSLVQKLERPVTASSKRTRRRKRSVEHECVQLWELKKISA